MNSDGPRLKVADRIRKLLAAALLAATAGCGAAPPEVRSPDATAAPDPGPAAGVPQFQTSLAIPEGAQRARVARVVDGDTIWAEPLESGPLPTGAAHRIRILQIDTPEVHGPVAECYGPEASAFATRVLPVGSTVYLAADQQDTDRFGRFLRYVWTEDGTFYNELAVLAGYARAVLFMPNDRHIGIQRAAETQAQQAGRGLWSACPATEDPRN